MYILYFLDQTPRLRFWLMRSSGLHQPLVSELVPLCVSPCPEKEGDTSCSFEHSCAEPLAANSLGYDWGHTLMLLYLLEESELHFTVSLNRNPVVFPASAWQPL